MICLAPAAAAQGGAAQGGAERVALRHTGPDSLLLGTGARASAAFRIVNEGAVAVQGRLGVELPEGWRLAPLAPELNLGAGEAAVRVLSFLPPGNAKAGRYELALSVHFPSGAVAADTLRLRIPEEPRVEVEVDAAPQWIAAGQPYTAVFRVANRGNTTLPIGLTLDSPSGFTARTATTRLHLEPGAFAGVEIVVETEDGPDAVTHPLTLTAVAPGDTARAVARVEVIPQGEGTRRDRGGIPAELRLRASDGAGAGTPVRLAASGPLNEGSSMRLDLLLQGPSSAYSAFGETDLYRIGLRAPRFTFVAGDQFFSLSQLTDRGREGLGAQAHFEGEWVQAGAFAGRDRRSSRSGMRVGAYTGIRRGSAALRTNWTRGEGRDGIREVWSADGSLPVTERVHLRGEYGLRPANGSRGWSAELQGDLGSLDVRLRRLAVDSAFGGGFGGLILDQADVRFKPWRMLYAEGSFSDRHTARIAEGSHPLERDQRLLRLAVGYGRFVSLEGRQVETTDRFNGDPTVRSGHAGKVRLGLPLGPLGIHSWYELGVAGAPDRSGGERFQQMGLRTDLRSGPTTISGSFEHLAGGTLYRTVAEEGIRGTFSAALELSPATRFHASASTTRFVAPVERGNLLVDAWLEQRLPSDHELTLRLRKKSTSGWMDHQETLLLLDYVIPLRLPIGRSSEAPAVLVRVFDAQTMDPVPGVVIEVGAHSVATDGAGLAVLRGLPPGRHPLGLDRRTAGALRVPARPLPSGLEVREGGPATNLEIGLVSAASLAVRSELLRLSAGALRAGRAERSPAGEASAGESLPGVLVELSREGERVRRATDSRGWLEIRDLRPGTWRIAVVSADLPPFHRFERDTVEVDIAPGGEAEVLLRAVPTERRVRFVAHGSVSDRPPGADTADQRQRKPVTAPGPVGEQASPPESPSTDGWLTFRTTAHTGTLLEVARQVYLQTGLWPKIWLANQELVSDPAAVPSGILLRIPPKAPLTWEEREAHSDFLTLPRP